jgi:hypothetical protein
VECLRVHLIVKRILIGYGLYLEPISVDRCSP